MLYYADRISDNIRKCDPEGYLICVNVPIARSGTQKYLPEELGQDGEDMITVYRPEEEVFSKATMASFEGKPVTNDHPDAEEGVTVDNIQWLQKGHCQNIRRGSGAESNMLIADLVITDPVTIQEVLDGKREISCGYNYELSEEDGKFYQRQIRGNHIAIVDKGRAGRRVCIKDSAPKTERREAKMAKKHNMLAKMLAAFARDAEPEEIEEAVNVIDELTGEGEEKDPIEQKLDNITDALEALQAKPEEETDEEPVEEEKPVMTDGDEKLDKILSLLEQLLAQKTADEEPVEKDPIEKLEEDLDELEAKDPELAEEDEDEEEEDPELVTPDEDPEEPDSKFVDPEEINGEDEDEEEIPEEEKPAVDKVACDAMRAAIKAVKPVIAKLPPSERRAASDAAVKSIRKSYGLSATPKRNDYLALKRRKAADSAKARKADEELGRQIMAKRNINYKK